MIDESRLTCAHRAQRRRRNQKLSFSVNSPEKKINDLFCAAPINEEKIIFYSVDFIFSDRWSSRLSFAHFCSAERNNHALPLKIASFSIRKLPWFTRGYIEIMQFHDASLETHLTHERVLMKERASLRLHNVPS